MPNARREIDLHWRASACCKRIVQILNVYENELCGYQCLLIVMEWLVSVFYFCCNRCYLVKIKSENKNITMKGKRSQILVTNIKELIYLTAILVMYYNFK